MKKFVLLFILLMCLSCQIEVTGPYTGTSYKFGVDENGIGVTAKPLAWDSLVNTYNRMTGNK